MILGISASTYTLIHVVLSVLALLTGAVVVWGMLIGKMFDGWTVGFLATMVLTSMTGFYFPSPIFGLSHAIGIISLSVLAVVILALFGYRLAGPWRLAYVMGTLLVLYLNVFSAIVQIFHRVSYLRALAPTQKEPPFIIAQLIVMVIFMVIGAFAVKTFHPGEPPPGSDFD